MKKDASFIFNSIEGLIICVIFIISPCNSFTQTIDKEYFYQIKKADSLLFQGNAAESLKHYSQVTAFNVFPETFYYISYVYSSIGNEEQAYFYFEKAVEKGFFYLDTSYYSKDKFLNYILSLNNTQGEMMKRQVYGKTLRYLDTINIKYPNIRKEFLVRKNTDQQFRNTYKKTDKEWEMQKQIDSNNMIYLLNVVEQLNGWPGIEEIGYDCASIPILIAIHADRFLTYQKQFLEYLITAMGQGNIPKSSFAMLYDRIKVNENKKQLFGTQVRWVNDTPEPYEIEYPELVEIYRQYFELPPMELYLNDLKSLR